MSGAFGALSVGLQPWLPISIGREVEGRMNMISLAVIGLLAGTSPAQSGQVWSFVTQTDTVVMGVDRTSVRKVGDEATFMMLNAWNGNPAAAYAVTTIRLDCAARTLRIGERRSYDATGAETGLFTREGPVMPVEPGSTMSKVAAAVCNDVWPAGHDSTSTSFEFYQRSMAALPPGN